MNLSNRYFKISFFTLAVLLMGSLNALVDTVLHPAIPFFDPEHLLVGGISATLTAFLYGLVLVHADGREKLLRELELFQDELSLRVEERTADLTRKQAELEEEITLRRKSEEALREATRRAEEASRIKSEFMANMSHEIRTPINGIMGMTQLLINTTTPTQQQRRYLDIIADSVRRLMETVNSILDFSNLKDGSLRPTSASFSLRAALGDRLAPLSKTAFLKGLALRWQIDPGVPDTLLGDKKFFQQIIVHLVHNAIKFSDRGAVTVTICQAAPPAAGRITLHATVADNGPGIPPGKRQEIFAPFVQVDGSLTRPQEGTGLGLAICAKMVELLGGEIWLTDTPGRGATFHFTAVFGTPQIVTAAKAVPRPVDGEVRILLVEDDPANRFVIQEIINQRGWHLTMAANGQEALDAFRALRFDLVLMDIQMPVMDGLAATAEMRRLENATGTHTPIVALTAHALEEERRRCLAAGMDDHLAKPIPPDALLTAIDTWLHHQPADPNFSSAG